MKIDLTEEEADYLADKTFWDWKRAEIDTWAIDIRPCPKEAIKRVKATEKWYRDLYCKLGGTWTKKPQEEN